QTFQNKRKYVRSQSRPRSAARKSEDQGRRRPLAEAKSKERRERISRSTNQIATTVRSLRSIASDESFNCLGHVFGFFQHREVAECVHTFGPEPPMRFSEGLLCLPINRVGGLSVKVEYCRPWREFFQGTKGVAVALIGARNLATRSRPHVVFKR